MLLLPGVDVGGAVGGVVVFTSLACSSDFFHFSFCFCFFILTDFFVLR
jgi:hypothetical protein